MSNIGTGKTPITDALIAKVMQEHSGTSKYAQAVYYEEVHQELAPLARKFETELIAMRAALEGAIPALDLLQARLEAGASIDHQSGRWHLFAADGNSIASGDTVRTMLMNLIFTDC